MTFLKIDFQTDEVKMNVHLKRTRKSSIFNYLLTVLMVGNLSGNLLFAQNFGLKELGEVSGGTLVVGLSGNDTIDDYLKEAIDRYWNFKEISDYLPLEEAEKMAKKDKRLFVLHLGRGASCLPTRRRYVSVAHRVMISDGKSFFSKPKIYSYYPTYGDPGSITREGVLFGVAALEHTCKIMVEDYIKSYWKWNAIFNKYNDELANKTVLLLENWLEEDLTEQEIQEIYPYPVKVVNDQVWLDAVVNKKENLVPVVIVPIPQAGNFTYVHYFWESGEPKILGTAYSKFNVQIEGNMVTPSNMGYITDKNVKMYAKMVQ